MIDLPDLPVRAVLAELRAALLASGCAVLEAPPGAGKSTLVPLALLGEPWLEGGRVLMLQPRRIAARAVAVRMAQLAGSAVGELVGYRTRLESRVTAATRIEVVTEGILTRMLQSDAALEGVSCVIFDEFHERNLQSDLGLALLLDARRHLRPDLRLLVMSATLDGDALARCLGNVSVNTPGNIPGNIPGDVPGNAAADAPMVRCAGRMFDVETHYAPATQRTHVGYPEPVERRAAAMAVRALAAHPGDALVFLPGVGEIRRAVAALADAVPPDEVAVLPLYGELSAAEQDAALRADPAGRRRVLVSTNVAETSLTIEGVRIVIDGGLERRQRFAPQTGMSRLETLRISRASADQRRGRAGRTAPGVCYRLWSASEHAALAPQSVPEIIEADLAPLALELACWGNTDPAELIWLDTPPAAPLAQARALLQQLQALDPRGHATDHGRRMAQLGTHPRLAHMILRAVPLGLGPLACDIAAVLGERDLLRSNGPQRDPDLRHRLDALRGIAPPPGLRVDASALQRVRRSAQLLTRQMKSSEAGPVLPNGRLALPLDAATGLLLAFAYPDRIGMSRRNEGAGEGSRYLFSGGRGGVLPGPSALGHSEFIVAADLDAGEREARIHLAAPLERAVLEANLAHSIVTADEVAWDSRSESVIARRVRRIDALIIEERPLRELSAEARAAALLQGVRSLGAQTLPWTPELRQWRARVLLVRAHLGVAQAAEWPDLSDASLLATLEEWLLPWLDGVSRREHLARIDLRGALHGLLSWEQRQQLEELAPTHLSVPSGSRIAIDYCGDSPALAVRLQEVFGMMSTPRLVRGQVPVTMELLSPARRPVQVTQDLASFWSRGYAEVRKELKGRYPRHYWPDDPYAATATRKVRPPGT